MHRCFLCALLFLVSFADFPTSAQNTPSLRGLVVDTTGAVVPGAALRLEDATGALVTQVTSGPDGAFLLSNLPAKGSFHLVTPPFAGFATNTIPLALPSSAPLKVTLTTESVEQIVSVDAGQTLSPDAASNRDTVTITGDQLRKLPVYDQDPIAALTPFLDAASGSSGGATIIVDGVEVKTLGVSASSIQEIRVNNDPYSAEFNRPGRGRIEIITKPGSPNFHGEFNFTFRDAIFNAKNYFAPVRPPEARRIFEGHLSGPVGRSGHTSFIVSGTRKEQDTAVAVSALTGNGLLSQNVLTPNRDAQASGRITHDFSSNHRLAVAYTYEGGKRTNMNVGGTVLPEAGLDRTYRHEDVLFNDRLILSPTLIHQLQVVLEKEEEVDISVTDAPSIQVSGAFIGGGAQANVSRTENTLKFNEVITWSHGKHYIRAGVQLPQSSRRAVDDHSNRLGTYKFASLADYAAGNAYVFTAQQGVGRGIYWINEFGSFFQDQITLNKHVQLVLGLRYDRQSFVPDNNNLAPRVSLAYAHGGGKTIFRIGTGIFYDRTGGDFPITTVLHNGVTLRTVQLQNTTFPIASGTDFSKIPTNIVRFAPNIRAPYAWQYSFAVEQKVSKHATLTAGYRGQVQAKSFRSRDANAPILPVNPILSANYPRPDPNFGQIQQIESGGRNLLNAFDLSFRGETGKWFAGQAQYTLSRFNSNTGGIGAFPQNQLNPNAEWGRDSSDRLQRFLLLGTIHPDHWLSLAVGGTLISGAPYTETTGNDDFHTGLGNARPVGIGRNTLEGGGVAGLDLLYSHDVLVGKGTGDKAKFFSFGLSAFNVLNRTNFQSYIGTLSSSRFGRPTTAGPGRQMQLSLGYRF